MGPSNRRRAQEVRRLRYSLLERPTWFESTWTAAEGRQGEEMTPVDRIAARLQSLEDRIADLRRLWLESQDASVKADLMARIDRSVEAWDVVADILRECRDGVS
jgi:hypothetical protein